MTADPIRVGLPLAAWRRILRRAPVAPPSACGAFCALAVALREQTPEPAAAEVCERCGLWAEPVEVEVERRPVNVCRACAEEV